MVREGQSEGEQVTRLRGLVFHLPTANYHTLRYLTSHLNKVAEHSEENKVSLSLSPPSLSLLLTHSPYSLPPPSLSPLPLSLPPPFLPPPSLSPLPLSLPPPFLPPPFLSLIHSLTILSLQMVLRNVAMVFGPTLMLPSGSEDFDLGAMNCTFTVVELICKHVCPSHCLFGHSLYLSVCLCLSVCLSVCLLSVCLSVFLSLSACLSVCLSLSLSLSLPVCLSVRSGRIYLTQTSVMRRWHKRERGREID